MQLQMVLPAESFDRYRDETTRPAVPEGYRLRTYREGDAQAYLALARRGGFNWEEKMLRTTLDAMLPDGLFFVEHLATGALVATTVAGHGSSRMHPQGGELGWVAVDPPHRGKRLGIIVCDAVLRRFIDAGYRDIFLHTDDFRLPAIKTYLNLGFRPLIHRREMAERWRLLYAQFGFDVNRLTEDALETVAKEDSHLGYRRWTPPAESGPDDPAGRKLRVGVLPLYLSLYDDQRPDMRDGVEAFRDRIVSMLKGLDESGGVEVVEAPITTLRSHVDQARELFERNRIDLLLTVHLAYSPSLLVADLLERLQVPLIILDTTPAREFDLEDESYLFGNHGVHGVMDLTSVLASRGVEYRVVAGHVDDPAYRNRIVVEIEGALMACRFRDQRIGVTGAPFSGMGDFEIRTDDLGERFGIHAVPIDPATVAERARGVAKQDVDRLVAGDRERLDVAQVDSATHAAAARRYLAVRALCEEERLSGYTMNFQHTGPELVPPFYAVSRLMSSGIGYAGESDIVTAALGRAAAVVGGRAMFSEIFCVDWEQGEIMFSHMGEIDPRFATGEEVRLVEKQALGHDDPSLYYRFRVDPVTVTMVNIGVSDGIPVRIVSTVVDLLDRACAPGVNAPHFFAKPRAAVSDFLESYAAAGGGHHVYLIEGDVRRQVEIMCRHLGLSCVEAG